MAAARTRLHLRRPDRDHPSRGSPLRPGAIESAIRDGADYDVEYRVVHPSGDLRWLHARGRAAMSADGGGVRRLAGVSLDITERKRADERQKLLVNELNHRVKNSLATVQSIAAQTLRSSASPEFFREAFETRLIALSQTHDLLTRESWEGASLREVFDVEMHAMAGEDRDHLRLCRRRAPHAQGRRGPGHGHPRTGHQRGQVRRPVGRRPAACA
jgi:hypothetical protein